MHVPCSDMLDTLNEYVDGELDAELCSEIEQHMAECGNCRIMVDTLRQTIVLYRDMGHQPVPDDAKSRLYAVLNLKRAPKGDCETDSAG